MSSLSIATKPPLTTRTHPLSSLVTCSLVCSRPSCLIWWSCFSIKEENSESRKSWSPWNHDLEGWAESREPEEHNVYEHILESQTRRAETMRAPVLTKSVTFRKFFFFFLRFFKMWIIFKVFVEFVTILLVFYVLGFCLQGMWDLNCPARNQTCTPCARSCCLNHQPLREVPGSHLNVLCLSLLICRTGMTNEINEN